LSSEADTRPNDEFAPPSAEPLAAADALVTDAEDISNAESAPAIDQPVPMSTRRLSAAEWLRVWFAGANIPRERRERLANLTNAIERHSDAPVNYVLRGELFLTMGQPEQAAADFEEALRLAQAQFVDMPWGILEQSMADRAAVGLAQAGRQDVKQGDSLHGEAEEHTE
jgi:tetratricopeptide (TPR) repeat protein